ncbi:FkbM family methyltransferase [Imperialibacter roseus]|uniref:FkbM family methyltransferase n=1 Tax=Imperialibacter roseus TaxID=1324217 RepID=A0ABZ0IM36_9BACT|nr:FkbM family methyltransferase [Imperialibacter roseus]WOK05577.1 FkbM family methyltransferase [Imperialibacter roseus]
MKKEIVVRDGVRFLIDRSDYMQWHILVGLPDNSWKTAAKKIERFDRYSTIHVFDVGANSGAFALKLAACFSDSYCDNISIHAFEPNPKMLKVLRDNCKLNPMLERMICIHPYGLGASNSMLPFSFSKDNSGAGRFDEKGTENVVSLTVKTLDEVCDNIEVNSLTFLKLDVEGFEPEVLKGARKTILRFKPAIYIEMTDKWFQQRGSSCKQILEYFWELGYQISVDNEKNLTPINRNDLHELESMFQYNILADI